MWEPQKRSSSLCNAIYRPAGSIERDTMSLHYLKPTQMDLLTDGPSQLGVKGPAYILRRKELPKRKSTSQRGNILSHVNSYSIQITN